MNYFFNTILPLAILFGIIISIKIIQLITYKKTDYYLQTHKAFSTFTHDTGSFGEYCIYNSLKKLDGYKKFLFNCYLPKENEETTEIDVLLLHESGIYVFESKNYSGWIFGNEKQQYWTQTLPSQTKKATKNHFLNPILQNKLHIKCLQSYLNTDIPLHSYIVFSERCTLKKIESTENTHHIIKRDILFNEVRTQCENTEKKLTIEQIDNIYAKLYPLTQVSEEVKQKHIETINNKIIRKK